MKITIFAAGSRGDIQPCIALGRGLQQAGYQVSLAAPQDFAGFVGEHGLAFRPLRGDVQQIMAGDTGRQFMETGGGNPLKSIRAVRTMIAPVIAEMADDAYAACRDADAIVEAKGLKQVTDTGAIAAVIDQVLAEQADKVAEYRSGKDKLFGFFVGQTMKKSGGKANPAAVNQILKQKLDG